LGADFKAEGGVAQLCIESMDFVMESSIAPWFHRTYLGASREYAQTCKAEYATLSQEQRSVLDGLLGRPLPAHVLYHARFLEPRGTWWQENRTQDQLRTELAGRNPREQEPRGPSAEAYLKMMEGHWTGPTPKWFSFFREFEEIGAFPSQEPTAEPEEVLGFMRVGQPVRFDATKIVPRELFNVSMEEMKRRHGEDAAKIPILGMNLATACRIQSMKSKHFVLAGESLICPAPYTLADIGVSPIPGAARVNLRRLTRFVDVDPMIVRGLGLEGEVERASGQLNIGYSSGEPHWDEQDNVFIGVHGINVVMVVAQNFTDAADGYKGSGYGMPFPKWLQYDHFVQRKNAFRHKHMPFYAMVLRPGEGAMIPSRSYHTVFGTHDRVGLNTFLEPRFGRMQWASNPNSHWHREIPERKALRNLWVKTIKAMWDNKRLPIHVQGWNLEVL